MILQEVLNKTMKKMICMIKKNVFTAGLIISCAAAFIAVAVRNGGILFVGSSLGQYWDGRASAAAHSWAAVFSTQNERDMQGTPADKTDHGSSTVNAYAQLKKDTQTGTGSISEKPAANEDKTGKKQGTVSGNDTVSGNGTVSGNDHETAAKPGVTDFITYVPAQVDSKYYSDPGKIALTTDYDYTTVDDSYFDDAAFIGDSRTLGLNDYSGWTNADFFCENGFCTYLWKKGTEVTCQKTHRKMTLEDAVSMRKYGKIYLMIGMNDCGYGTTEDFRGRLQDMITMIEGRQPDAIIYLMANLHISKAKSDGDAIFNNTDINDKNVVIAECADGVRTFYLDYNGLYTDDSGFLKQELTFDGVHLYAKYYQPWLDYIKSHAVK